MSTVVWFRQDLRIADNPALRHAAALGEVIPVYILDDITPPKKWRLGGASRWWLHHSLAALRKSLGGLLVMRGDPHVVLREIVDKTGANGVVWNRCYEPYAIARDAALKEQLHADGFETASFNASMLHEPWEVTTQGGAPYKVFTPYWRASRGKPVSEPLDAGALNVKIPRGLGVKLDELGLLPTKPNWAAGWPKLWTPGEAGAVQRLTEFFERELHDYGELRNRPDLSNTSRLSPHLHWGEISPRQIWHRTQKEVADGRASIEDADKFLSEVGWREFAYQLLYYFPNFPDSNWRSAFDGYPLRESASDLRVWQRGQTGYPLVDAGMRELWQTGVLHNRVRMIVASFLIKHLRLDWRAGQAWFWDTLVDADLANNSAGWQWVAGSGADAAPYFRIFNPMSQGQKFDPDGAYVRRWCPELAALPTEFVHAPFLAPADVLAKAGVTLGKDYPLPMVDHAEARAAALAGYSSVRSAG